MSDVTYITFSGLNAPVHLRDAGELRELVSAVVPAWPAMAAADPDGAAPFASITPESPGRWTLDVHADDSAPRSWDAVDVVCDLVAELAWEKIRSEPDLLCLHAAGVAFGDRLVVFPNARRAGKSTLSIALARLGHTLFSDDYIPVRVDRGDGTIRGLANGILPRLRLPVPASFSDGFRDWAGADPAPGNHRYKYLQNLPLAPGGTALPLGAIVLLDRSETPTAPRLEPIAREEALAGVIGQNFARSLHAGVILRSLDTLTGAVPLYRLSYSNAEEAAAFLQDHPALAALPEARIEGDIPAPAAAPLDRLGEAAPSFEPAYAYVQAPGLTETAIGGEHFLADGSGLGIHRLNPGSAMIWRVLEEPTTLDEAVELLCTAFTDVDPDQIAQDTKRALTELAAARLIQPAQAGQDADERGVA